MTTATLQVVYLGPSNWRVLDDRENHSVQHVGEGLYRCTCPTDDSKNDWAALTRQAKKNLAIAQAF